MLSYKLWMQFRRFGVIFLLLAYRITWKHLPLEDNHLLRWLYCLLALLNGSCLSMKDLTWIFPVHCYLRQCYTSSPWIQQGPVTLIRSDSVRQTSTRYASINCLLFIMHVQLLFCFSVNFRVFFIPIHSFLVSWNSLIFLLPIIDLSLYVFVLQYFCLCDSIKAKLPTVLYLTPWRI